MQCTAGDVLVSKHELFRNPTTHGDIESCHQLSSAPRELVLFREHGHHTQSIAPGHDGRLVYREGPCINEHQYFVGIYIGTEGPSMGYGVRGIGYEVRNIGYGAWCVVWSMGMGNRVLGMGYGVKGIGPGV